jgi:Ca2+-dependent lipid-binding protein
MADIYDRLEVRVIEARGLLNPHSIVPSPFAEVTVGQDSVRTDTAMETDKPAWNSNMMIFTQLLINDVDTVHVHIYHVDQFAGKTSPLGCAYVPLSNFYHSPTVLIDEWYPLTEASHMTERATGSVRLQITYFNVIDPELQSGEVPEGLKEPNCLEIRVLNAVGVSTSPVEAFVVIEVDKHRIESKVR